MAEHYSLAPDVHAKQLEESAAALLRARRELLQTNGLPLGFGVELFTEIRAFGIKWNVELPVFRRKEGVIETLLYFGAGRPDGYRDTYFVPGAQQPAGMGPEGLLAGIGKKLGVELDNKNCRQIDTLWAADCPVAPLLSLVYATEAKIPDEVKGAWYPIHTLPDPIAPNHRRLIDIGLRDFMHRESFSCLYEEEDGN